MTTEPEPDKLLFTPGPLTTSGTVKRAMLRDVGSRDREFIDLVAGVRRRLVRLAGGGDAHDAVLVQGSGTFGVEAVCCSGLPEGARLLVLANGVYGRRLAEIARIHGVDTAIEEWPETEPVAPDVVARRLAASPDCSHIALVHCETTTGILNPLAEVAEVAATHGVGLIVDAMSSFGAVPIDVDRDRIDYLIASSNKCIQGVPGFALVVFRRDALRSAERAPRSLTLDLHAQWQGLQRNGQFRFTPPTHAILAFAAALDELEAEGGVAARGARYRANQELLRDGMRALGFDELVARDHQSPVITAFRNLPDEKFSFAALYELLSARGLLIYPGVLSKEPSFRIGTIGALDQQDVRRLLAAIADALHTMRG